MRKKLRTVKGQVILLMVLFALIITLLVLAFSFYMMYTSQRRTTVQSTEFNLQLVASIIEQDLRDLATLGKWCGQNDQIVNYLLTDYRNAAHNMDAYYRMQEEYFNNRAGQYVRRLIVFDLPAGSSPGPGHSGEGLPDGEGYPPARKILQVGNLAGTSVPVTIYNVNKIFDTGVSANAAWQAPVPDPFILSKEPDNPDFLVIPFVCPAYNPSEGIEIGTVFLAATTKIVTDKLQWYKLPENPELYISMADRYYRIEDTRMIPADFPYEAIRRNTRDPVSSNTTALLVRDREGKSRTLVSYPLRDGIALIQVLSNIHFFPQEGGWPGLVAGLCILILILALIITLNLDRNISRPVAQLRKKIDAISRGDFSSDPDIESDNELGQVGQGVNRMAQEITLLLDKRISDEKNKRDLEYRMLQSQINPHFLYNTLNSIKWMATIQNAAGIAEMTTSLSRLLQTMSKDIRKVVPLGDELALLDDYLIIQKYRYGGSVSLVKETEDEELLKTPIPRFTLQPLVENAIFHGIEPKGSGTIRVDTVRSNNDVLVHIRDDGVGIKAETITKIYTARQDGSGMLRELGVHNVDERLRYAFGEGYGLSILSEEGQYTEVTIRLPGDSPQGIGGGG
ncbi:MAG: sensor histidine kinase [Treponema sp.]|jgi:two-component system sensor histidine kinase YesM|nr:sensor histidine kinase [Treponema sp.]